MFERISVYLTNQICELDPSTNWENTKYGILLFISEIVKLSIIFIVCFFIGYLPFGACITLIYWLLRLNLGGIHAKSQLGCLISSIVIILIVIEAAYLSAIKPLILLLAVAPITILISCLYAPADLPEKPVISIKQRKRLKRKGIITLIIFFVISIFVPDIWSNIILYTCLIQSLFMTPVIYKITNNQYGYKRRCEKYEKSSS